MYIEEAVEEDQQGMVEVNHSITWIGALINPNAISTSIVTHKQHGHMHDNNNLQRSQTNKESQESEPDWLLIIQSSNFEFQL